MARGTAPNQVISVVDPESRHVHKTAHGYRDGFKAHIVAEPDTGLITAADLTAGDVGDADAAMGLLEDKPTGAVVLADSAHGTGEMRAGVAEAAMRR